MSFYLKNGRKLSFNAFGQLEDGGHVNATKTVRDLYQWICMITRLNPKQAGLFFCNSCLNDPIDLKFGM